MTIASQDKKTCIVCQGEQKPRFKKKGYTYMCCTSCCLLSTDPIPNDETIETHYAQAFKEGNYELGQEHMMSYMRVYEDFVNELERKLVLYKMELSNLRVLDIGCFTGELLGLLREKGADVYGLELQAEAVRIANERLPGRIFKADVFSNDFPQMKFDVVIMSGVIEHVVNPIRLLKRSAEILKPGGVLMLQTPNSTSLLSRLLGRFWPPCAPVEHIHLFSKKSLVIGLRQAGFDEIVFKSHWKKLPFVYVYNNFRNFGPEFFRLLRPLYIILPKFIAKKHLPFYVGEVIVFSRKNG